MHKAMTAWCARQDREGWQSDEVRRWATFVRLSLWGLSQHEDAPPVLRDALTQYMANLERAKSALTSHVG